MKLLILGLLVLAAFSASGQQKVSGTVKTVKGKPIPLVSVTLKDSYDGATTDSLGRFSFQTYEKGEQVLVFTALGYAETEVAVMIGDSALVQEVVLKEQHDELDAVVITAGTFEAGDVKRGTVLNSLDIATTASANADVVAAINTLPGTQQVGETGGLFVRGGSAEEARIFIDGTLVNNFFYTSIPDIAQRGRFSPFIFKGTVFSSGGYSALYGQALSSALILESIDFPETSASSFGISTVGLNAGYEHLSKSKTFSSGISYSYTNLAPYLAVFKQRYESTRHPEFHNIDLNFRIKTSETGILKAYGYFNGSGIGLSRPDIDSLDFQNNIFVRNLNYYFNLSWQERIGAGWNVKLGASFSDNIDNIRNKYIDEEGNKIILPEEPFDSKNFSVDTRSKLLTFKPVIEKKLSGLSAIRFGTEWMRFEDDEEYNSINIHSDNSLKDHITAAFAEADIYLNYRLAAKLGTRYEYSSIVGKDNIAPRVSMAYKVSKRGQFSLAYGEFFQRPDNEYFMGRYETVGLDYMRASHYIFNYQTLSPQFIFRAEIFYKDYHDLITTRKENDYLQKLMNGGKGYAKGFEFFLRDKKTLKNVDYWLSYSYLDTRRQYLNFPEMMTPNYAARHTASLVVKKFVLPIKTQFNASYTFATGRPYYDIRFHPQEEKYYLADKGKTIPYNSLSLSINYLPHIGKQNAKAFTVFVFSMNNVLGSKQIFGYNYSYSGHRKLPILPTARQFLFLGCFISIGTDRTEEVINSNL